MENKLEQLLNSLIEKGWLPFGEWCHRSPYKRVSVHKNYNKERIYVLFYSNNHSHWKVLRQVVSKESWLWQFVCENGMIKEEHKHERILDPTFWEWWADCKRQEHDWNYWYRLIESSLKDESELEDFLLNSIKLD